MGRDVHTGSLVDLCSDGRVLPGYELALVAPVEAAYGDYGFMRRRLRAGAQVVYTHRQDYKKDLVEVEILELDRGSEGWWGTGLRKGTRGWGVPMNAVRMLDASGTVWLVEVVHIYKLVNAEVEEAMTSALRAAVIDAEAG